MGFLFCHGRDEALSRAPLEWPGYDNRALCPYHYLEQPTDIDERYHFAPALIDLIAATPHQEIATHTYSHYYCREAGQTAATFRADIAAAIRIAATRGLIPRSLVFPRNQWHPDYLAILAEHGITAYRDNEEGWLYAARHHEVFHLWWDPHNFGVDTDQNMRFLGQVIEEFERLRRNDGMRSLGMAELAGELAER